MSEETDPPPPSSPPPSASDSTDKLSASVDEIERAIESALARLEAERKVEHQQAEAESARKSAVSQRVSIAALLLTMMLSFLGFVRAGEDSASTDDKVTATQAKNDAASEWALYQTKQAQRSSLREAEDLIERTLIGTSPNDPKRRIARFHHREYEEQVRLVDEENRLVFLQIQALNRREYDNFKEAAQHDRRKDRYDMGIRTLTLALVLISVTLLVYRDY